MTREPRTNLGTLFKMFQGIESGGPRDRIGADTVGPLKVSTVLTADMGWETALGTRDGVYPVERYNSKQEAELGHKRWVADAATLDEIPALGYGTILSRKVPIDRS